MKVIITREGKLYMATLEELLGHDAPHGEGMTPQEAVTALFYGLLNSLKRQTWIDNIKLNGIQVENNYAAKLEPLGKLGGDIKCHYECGTPQDYYLVSWRGEVLPFKTKDELLKHLNDSTFHPPIPDFQTKTFGIKGLESSLYAIIRGTILKPKMIISYELED